MKDRIIDCVDPRIDRLRDWVYGSEDFLKRVLSMAEDDDPVLHRRRVRRVNPVSVDAIIAATESQYAVSHMRFVREDRRVLRSRIYASTEFVLTS